MDDAERQAETGEKFCRTVILRIKRFYTVNVCNIKGQACLKGVEEVGKYLLLDFFGTAAKITGDALTALTAHCEQSVFSKVNIVTNNTSHGHSQKSVLAQLVKNFPAFAGRQSFITICTTACHLSMS
jgi:hypothetical protein